MNDLHFFWCTRKEQKCRWPRWENFPLRRWGNRAMVWKSELAMANLVSVYCKQRSWAICGHLQNCSLFVHIPHRSKSLWLLVICILSLVCQREGASTCLCERVSVWTRMCALNRVGIFLKRVFWGHWLWAEDEKQCWDLPGFLLQLMSWGLVSYIPHITSFCFPHNLSFKPMFCTSRK